MKSLFAGSRGRLAIVGLLSTMLCATTACSQSEARGEQPPVANQQQPSPAATASPSSERATSDFPDGYSTGVRPDVRLRPYFGDLTVTRAGTTVENLDIHGSIFVEAANVTIRNVRVTCSHSWWIIKALAPRVTIIDSTLTVDRSKRDNYCQYGIAGGEGIRIFRTDISQTPNGLVFTGDTAEVVDNYVHAQVAYPGRKDHVDAAQLNGGGKGPYVFRHNHFSVPEGQTACLALFDDFGRIRRVLVENNLFDGGGYTVYGGTETATGVRFINNRFGRSFWPKGGRYGPVTRFNRQGKGNMWKGNQWLDTSQRVLP